MYKVPFKKIFLKFLNISTLNALNPQVVSLIFFFKIKFKNTKTFIKINLIKGLFFLDEPSRNLLPDTKS